MLLVLTSLDAPGIAMNQATQVIGVWERINMGVLPALVVVLSNYSVAEGR